MDVNDWDDEDEWESDDEEKLSVEKSYVLYTSCSKHTNYTRWRAWWAFTKVGLYFIAVVGAFTLYRTTTDCNSSMKQSVFLVGFASVLSMSLEIAFGAISWKFSNEYYTELLRKKVNKSEMCLVKSLPTALSVFHFVSLCALAFGWYQFGVYNSTCNSSDSSFWGKFLTMCSVSSGVWLFMLFMGFFCRTKYVMNSELYFPPIESDYRCCGFDFTCERMEKRRKPRCCRSCHNRLLKKPKGGNNRNNQRLRRETFLSKKVMACGECFYRFWKGWGLLFQWVQNHKHEIGP